ncbi:MAG: tyrosine-type recombinase/integrase [Bacteroidales bacterium]|nr:tyrosine-type recombinase/integrase [Bacteroidales bacterium]
MCNFVAMNISVAIERFLNYISTERKYSEYTLRNYSGSLQLFANYCKENGVEEIEEIEAREVREWQMGLTENGTHPNTIRLHLVALRTWFRFMRREGWLHTDVMAKVRTPKIPPRLPVTFRESEVEHLYDADLFANDFEGQRDKLLLRMLYETGMRRAEVVSLTNESINFSNNSIKVRGKGNKERIIPIENELAQNIRNYFALKEQIEDVDEHLFVRPNGKPITYAEVGSIVKRYMSMLSHAEKITPHVFRHTFATHLLNEGADISAIKELLGHADIHTTEIYTHVTREHIKETYKHAHPRAQKKRR